MLQDLFEIMLQMSQLNELFPTIWAAEEISREDVSDVQHEEIPTCTKFTCSVCETGSVSTTFSIPSRKKNASSRYTSKCDLSRDFIRKRVDVLYTSLGRKRGGLTVPFSAPGILHFVGLTFLSFMMNIYLTDLSLWCRHRKGWRRMYTFRGFTGMSACKCRWCEVGRGFWRLIYDRLCFLLGKRERETRNNDLLRIYCVPFHPRKFITLLIETAQIWVNWELFVPNSGYKSYNKKLLNKAVIYCFCKQNITLKILLELLECSKHIYNAQYVPIFMIQYTFAPNLQFVIFNYIGYYINLILKLPFWNSLTFKK